MGLFSSKKKIYVDSVAYNMAGDYSQRMNYLKTITVGSMLKSTATKSLMDNLKDAVYTGTHVQMRNLFRWCKTNYADGIPRDYLTNTSVANYPVIYSYMDSIYGPDAVSVSNADISYALAYYWAAQWVYDNYTDVEDDDWSYELYDNSPTNSRVNITYKDEAPVTINMANYNPDAMYVFITFSHINQTTGDISTDRKIHIYRFGSGSTSMDSMKPGSTTQPQELMPFAPIRIDNKFITATQYKAKYYDKVNEFHKKLFGGAPVDDLIEQLEDNEKLSDIDYAFIQFGVSLNTEKQSGLRYIMQFGRLLVSLAPAQSTYFLWRDAYKTAIQPYLNNPNESTYSSFLTNRIPRDPPIRNVSQVSNWLPGEYRILHYWSGASESIVSGSQHPIGHCWIERVFNEDLRQPRRRTAHVGPDEYETYYTTEPLEIPTYVICRQLTANTFRRVTIYGLAQENFVYSGKSVYIDCVRAMEVDEPGDESGFIVPIHIPTYKKLSLIDRNQLATENVYILFNCYVVKKIRWYQRGIFKFLFAIVIAIASVIFAPAAGGIGLLGSAASVGASLGLTGMMGAIVGAAINAIAAMAVMTITQYVGTALFGDAFGAIIGAVLGFIAMGGLTNLFGTGSFTLDWSSFLRVDNIMKMTDALGQGYVNSVQQKIVGMSQEYQAFMDNVNQQLKDIEKMMRDVLGMGDTAGMRSDLLVDATRYHNESRETYLARTLMTGMDIAELSNSMIGNYTDVALTLPDEYA